jgi:hypothetical protein
MVNGMGAAPLGKRQALHRLGGVIQYGIIRVDVVDIPAGEQLVLSENGRRHEAAVQQI